MGEALAKSNMGDFKNGHPKYGGRQKGTPNKTPVRNIVKETLDKYGVNPIEYLLGLLPKLAPNQQASVMQTLMLYSHPRPREVESERTEERTTQADEASTGDLLKVLRATNGNDNSGSSH